MRVYVATTPDEIKQLVAGEVTFEEYLTPEQFEFDSGVDEEEREHLISLLAAEDSLELNQGKAGFVIAVDLSEEQLNGESITIGMNQVAALLHSVDGEELSWFAADEIKHHIDEWL
jgi:hypothetical protein